MRLFLPAIILAQFASLALLAQTEYHFSDGGRPVTLRMAEDEVFSRGGRGISSAAKGQKWGSGEVVRLGNQSSSRRFAQANWAKDRSALAPVFYYTSDLPSAERLAALPLAERERRLSIARRVMTAKLHVRMELDHTSSLAPTQPLAFEKSLVEGWVLVSYADAFAALDAADWLIRQGGFDFSPVFSQAMVKRQSLQRVPTDPLYPRQWHLQSTAFNLSMKNAWDIATGKGINMTIVDDGLDIKHEDLSANAYALGQGLHANFNGGAAEDPSPGKAEDSHGTSCAGLAGAVGFNNIGVIGVAPEVGLMGIRLIAGDAAEDANGKAMAWQPEGIITHVSSNSWGPVDDGMADGRISSLQLAGLANGATKNRDGLGTIFVISAGNGRGKGDNQSYDGFSSTRYGIAVAAVNKSGKQSSYSESGVGVAVSAFGGESEPPEMMWSVNNMGQAAFDIKAKDFPTSQAPINYTDAFNGTSAAAPQVSGAAALLLERNPKLGYRDVKEILMRTANPEGLEGDSPFVKNGGDFVLSHSFGAGVINVSAALELASKWTNLGTLLVNDSEIVGSADISESDFVTTEFDLSTSRLRVEHVEISFNVKHANRGDLAFQLVSPSGMASEVPTRPNDENADFNNYTFTSVMHWGESSTGKWKFIVGDLKKNGIVGKIDNVRLRVYGVAR